MATSTFQSSHSRHSMQRTTQLKGHLNIPSPASATMPNLTLISATPSPFARMNRIALLEKGIPFTIRNEIPWHSDTTETPQHNPLEKLPILLFDDGREPVYDSAHIQEYIVQKFADQPPLLLTGDLDTDLKARQIQVLCEGILDAFVIANFEKARGEGKKSELWLQRQERKIDGGMKALNELVKTNVKGGGEYLWGDVLTIADIAVVCTVGHIEFAGVRKEWKEKYPELAKFCEGLDKRENFKSTRPVMFDLRTEVVV
ncbi:hypothetical protein CERZMDRAFT_118308 [Cercospora zeae-maydis SCOH1-5]|uniref:GST N-terminal domain-containing protein n=1 Tax=Cercospora zeae-maydis SCOH1-5 TaxID=717836 RepID=A0A6A6F9Q3_9PEZI|nr:hypothetical protein CERZMDRAFT_118308 [Cercospora zeae-maydis SCOH1-5]